MAKALLHRYVQTPRGDWVFDSSSNFEVRPADAVLAAALASPGGIVGNLRAALAEAALLLTYLPIGSSDQLVWKPEFSFAAPHMQRFLTQAAAIATTTQLAREYGWDHRSGHRLFWYDALRATAPAALQDFLPQAGAFPDVLCETPSGWVSIESRGRSSARPKKTTPNSAQIGRLGELADWASTVRAARAAPNLPAWAMAWAWFEKRGTQIDFFDPGDPVVLTRSQNDLVEQMAIEFDGSVRESAFSSSRSRQLLVRGRVAPAVISVVEDPYGNGAEFAGIAIASTSVDRSLRFRRDGDDFDALQYRGSFYFAGTIPVSEVDRLDEIVGEQLEGAIE